MLDHDEIHLTLRNRLLDVADLPDIQAWENVDLDAPPPVDFLEEDFVPATARLLTMPAANGVIEETGLYVLRYVGVANRGTSDMRPKIDAILAAFPPGFSFPALANGDALRVRGDVAPTAGQIVPDGSGRAISTISIPWRAYSTATAA